jgi:hypothetical protein
MVHPIPPTEAQEARICSTSAETSPNPIAKALLVAARSYGMEIFDSPNDQMMEGSHPVLPRLLLCCFVFLFQ